MTERPRVGIGVCILKDGKVLVGKRKGHGEGTWAFPGGKLDFGESWEECAKREVLEETGIEIDNVRFKTATNDHFKESGLHYITLFVMADHVNGEAQVMEPDKCEKWEWHDYDGLPSPLFLSMQNLVDSGWKPL